MRIHSKAANKLVFPLAFRIVSRCHLTWSPQGDSAALARNVRWSPSRPHRPFADEIADTLQKEGSRPAPTNLDRPDRLVDIEPHWPDRHQLLRCIRLSVQHRDARF